MPADPVWAEQPPPSFARLCVSKIVESRSIVQRRAGSRSCRPSPGEWLPADPVELTDMAPGEPPRNVLRVEAALTVKPRIRAGATGPGRVGESN